MWPPPLNKHGGDCEWYVNDSIHKMVMALVVKQIGLTKERGRAWLGVTDPNEHPNKKRRMIYKVLDKKEDVRNIFVAATTNDGYDRFVVDGRAVYETMIQPIITSFVHGTEWVEELRQFSEGAESWMASVKGLGIDFFQTGGLGSYLWESAKEDWLVQDEEEEDSKKWWTAYDETRTEHLEHFMECFKYLTTHLSSLIRELDETFRQETPKNVGVALRRREWEHVAISYVRKEGELAFLFHYGTVEEFANHLNFVVPKRKRESDAFVALMAQKWRERIA